MSRPETSSSSPASSTWPAQLRVAAVALIATVLIVAVWQGGRLAAGHEGGKEGAGQGTAAAAGGDGGAEMRPASTGPRPGRGEPLPNSPEAAAFHAALKDYRAEADPQRKSRMLAKLVMDYGRSFATEVFELVKHDEPAGEPRRLLLQMGLLTAESHPEIHAEALDSFGPGKERSGLIIAALGRWPQEKLGGFLGRMESSSTPGDVAETARLIREVHVLYRPEVTGEQLDRLQAELGSPELKAAIQAEKEERQKRGAPVQADTAAEDVRQGMPAVSDDSEREKEDLEDRKEE